MKAKRFVWFAYLAGVHLLLLVALAASDLIPKAGEKLGFWNSADLRRRSGYADIFACHVRSDGNVPDGAIVFIGDSTVLGLCVPAVAPNAINYGIPGDTTRGVLERLPAYESLARAQAIVVSIGVNDLSGLPDWKIVRNWTTIANGLPAHVPVYFNAILPLDERCQPTWTGRNRGLIRSLNEQLASLLASRPKRHFVDPTARLLDATGNLSPDFHAGDGLHLNAAGNAIWIDALRTALAAPGD